MDRPTITCAAPEHIKARLYDKGLILTVSIEPDRPKWGKHGTFGSAARDSLPQDLAER